MSTLGISMMDMPPDFKAKYVGGRGYAVKFIWDRTNSKTTYDSPENILVMASGPLGNEPRFPGSGKFIVGTISPLTETNPFVPAPSEVKVQYMTPLAP